MTTPAPRPDAARQARCLACEPASCEAGCGLVRGDGEAVATLVSRHVPRLLLLDFDRTLASTRAGADPTRGEHTLDPELLSAASAPGVALHVVTRNPHHSEIETFLAERKINVAGVHVVPKRASKADVMLQLMPSLADEANKGTIMAVFVDDDIRELTRASVAGLPLLRVLFSRTGL